MSPMTRRRSWIFLLFASFLLLTVSRFAFVVEQHGRGSHDADVVQGRAAAWHSPPVRPHRASNSAHSRVIDPVLAYSTYLGGTNFANIPTPNQGAYASFVDPQGNVYLTGSTNSPNFPVTPGVIQTTNPSQAYVSFVSKISPDGKSLVFSTYVNLTKQYVNSALAVDSSGDIFVAGTNPSFVMPAGTTPFQATPKTANSILIVKLNSTATKVLNATYLSGTGDDNLFGLAVDGDGNVYAAGGTVSSDFPTKNPLQATPMGSDAFVTKLDSSLSTLLYSTYLGGGSAATVNSIAVDSSENAYVVGSAESGFPTTSGAAQATCTSICGFFAKLDPTGSSLSYATYIDGSFPMSVALDQSQNVIIAGTISGSGSDFPQVKPLQPCDSSSDFVSEINAAGALSFSTCLGINGLTYASVDSSGIIYVTGAADNTLPLKNPIQMNANPTPSGTCFVSAIDPNAGSLLFSSFLGGTCTSVGTDSNGNIYVAGFASAPFPIFNAFQSSSSPPLNGCIVDRTCTITDATLQKISPTDGAAAALSPAAVAFPPQLVGTPSPAQPVTVVDLGSAPLTVSNAVATGDFSTQNGCVSAVAPAGGTCAIQVTFTPTAVGARTGTLTITDSAASTQSVSLTGTAIAAGLGLGFAPSNGSILATAGSTGTTQLVVGGAGIAGSVTLTCTGAPTGATCTLSPSTLQISATSASMVGLSVTTAARSHLLFVPLNFMPWLWASAILVSLILLWAASGYPHLKLSWRLAPLMALVLCACGSGGSSGGGSSGGPSSIGTPAGNYTIVVTAKSGSNTQSFNVPLTVQ
jgi:hypothetical protein